MLKQQIAQILIENKAVKLNSSKPYIFASGIKSPVYCDNRILISHPQSRSSIVTGFMDMMNDKKIDCDVIAGTATAGIPWAAWIAEKTSKPMIYVRESAKEHGRQSQIEGEVKAEQKVVLIEDLISSGGSSVKAIQAIQETGILVTACLAIFTYEMKKAQDAFVSVNVPLYTLSDFNTLIEVAKKLGYISDKQIKIILEWNQDPPAWGRKYGF